MRMTRTAILKRLFSLYYFLYLSHKEWKINLVNCCFINWREWLWIDYLVVGGGPGLAHWGGEGWSIRIPLVSNLNQEMRSYCCKSPDYFTVMDEPVCMKETKINFLGENYNTLCNISISSCISLQKNAHFRHKRGEAFMLFCWIIWTGPGKQLEDAECRWRSSGWGDIGSSHREKSWSFSPLLSALRRKQNIRFSI